MISTTKIKEIYEAACGYTLYNDYGGVDAAIRVRNEIEYPVCGLFKMQPVTLTAIRTPFIGVTSANIEIIAPTHMMEEVRTTLNTAVAASLNGVAMSLPDEEDEGKMYSVSFTVQTCTVGEKADFGAWYGECVTLYQTISFVIIEEGISSYDTVLKIDGCEVPLLSLSETKVHTTSVYPSANAISHTASEQEAFGIDFATPYVKSDICELFREAVNGHTGNKAHCVEIIKNGVTSAYIMAFSAAADSVQPPSNIGFNISMTEISPTIAHFDGRWRRYTHKGKIVTQTTADSKFPEIKGFDSIVFWGDGSAEYMAGDLAPYHVYTDGKEIHDIMCFTYYPLNAVREIMVGDELMGVRLYVDFDGYDGAGRDSDSEAAEDLYHYADGGPLFGSANHSLKSNGSRIYFDIDNKNEYVYVDEDITETGIYGFRKGSSFICPISDPITYYASPPDDFLILHFYVRLSDVSEEVIE